MARNSASNNQLIGNKLTENYVISRPTGTSNSAKKDTIRAEQLAQLQRADELITHQHVIRRFRTRHKKEFDLLCGLRAELNAILKDGAKADPKEKRPTLYPRMRLLAEATSFLGRRKNLQLFSKAKHDGAELALRQVLEDVFFQESHGWMISDSAVDKLLSTLSHWAPQIIEMHNQLNYLDYFSPFGLTCFVPGEKLYACYIDAMYGKLKLQSYVSQSPESISDESLMLHLDFDEKSDEGLAALLHGVPYRPWYISRNIQIFGGSDHKVRVDDETLENRLILSVPTDEAPDRIDDTLQAFRRALLQEYEKASGSYYNITTLDFDSSNFMNQRGYVPCMIKEWKQFRCAIVGLWTWDICLEKEMDPDQASAYVRNKVSKAKKPKSSSLKNYKDISIKTYYNNAAKEIRESPHMKKKKWAGSSKIDVHITRAPQLELGRRRSSP